MTLLGEIFGVDPVTGPFEGQGTAEEEAALRNAAAKALTGTPVVK